MFYLFGRSTESTRSTKAYRKWLKLSTTPEIEEARRSSPHGLTGSTVMCQRKGGFTRWCKNPTSWMRAQEFKMMAKSKNTDIASDNRTIQREITQGPIHKEKAQFIRKGLNVRVKSMNVAIRGVWLWCKNSGDLVHDARSMPGTHKKYQWQIDGGVRPLDLCPRKKHTFNSLVLFKRTAELTRSTIIHHDTRST